MMDSEKLVEEFSGFCNLKLKVCRNVVGSDLGQCIEQGDKVDREDGKSVRGYRYYLEGCMDSMNHSVTREACHVKGALDLMEYCYSGGLLPDTEYKRMKEKAAAVVDELEDLRGEAIQKTIEMGLGTYKELGEPVATDQAAAIQMVNTFFDSGGDVSRCS